MLLLAVPGVPLLVALALALRPESRALRALAPCCALPALLAGWLVPSGQTVSVAWVLQGATLGLDATGRAFMLTGGAIGLCAVLAVPGVVRERTGRLLAFVLVVLAGSLGAAVAQDLPSYYMTFALMSFAAYGLVVHDRSQRSRRAGRVYLTFVLAADMAIFAALALIVRDTAGDLLFETAREVLPTSARGGPVLLLILGFG